MLCIIYAFGFVSGRSYAIVVINRETPYSHRALLIVKSRMLTCHCETCHNHQQYSYLSSHSKYLLSPSKLHSAILVALYQHTLLSFGNGKNIKTLLTTPRTPRSFDNRRTTSPLHTTIP